MANSNGLSPRVRAERTYLALVVGLPLLAILAYFVFAFFLRDHIGGCPPACRDQDLTARAMAQADFQGADLRAANLARADLLQTNFANADLSFANLAGADLAQANLQNANLTAAALNAARLHGADLRGAILRGARLQEASFAGADLRGADVGAATLDGAELRGALIDDSTLLDPRWRLVWQIVNEPAQGRELAGADLRAANLTACLLYTSPSPRD